MLTGNVFIAGGAGGFAGNMTRQRLKMITQGESMDYFSLATETTLGAATGWLPGVKLPGVTTGRGSLLAIHRQMMTKLEKGQIKNVRPQTAAKMFVGESTDKSLILGTAAAGLTGKGLTCLSGDCGNEIHVLPEVTVTP